MNFFEFLDRQLCRLTFRVFVGHVALAAPIGALVMFSFHSPPKGNEELLAGFVGVVVGWGGAVVTSQYGDWRFRRGEKEDEAHRS